MGDEYPNAEAWHPGVKMALNEIQTVANQPR
jgi:hypothetical protein